jgi:aryl-alcohol dehydrogenase-like predicted oxidoreductase
VEKVRLGCSDLVVSRLCFGTEPFAIKKGPEGMKDQGDLIPEEGGWMLKKALDMGVNFWDTSDDYGTHPHVRVGLGLVSRREVVVADKSNALTYEEGEEAIKRSLFSLGTDYVDLMLLHNVPSRSVRRRDTMGRPYESGSLGSRIGALRAWLEAKESGIVRAVGLTTHSTEVLKQALEVPEIEVVCTTLNLSGMFVEGNLEDHLGAIAEIHDAGKGVYAIKLLQAGRIRDEAKEALKWAFGFHEVINAWNIGMYDIEEVAMNKTLLEESLSQPP